MCNLFSGGLVLSYTWSQNHKPNSHSGRKVSHLLYTFMPLWNISALINRRILRVCVSEIDVYYNFIQLLKVHSVKQIMEIGV